MDSCEWTVELLEESKPTRIRSLLVALVFEAWEPDERRTYRIVIKDRTGALVAFRSLASRDVATQLAQDAEASLRNSGLEEAIATCRLTRG